ncbi:sodium:calcium antiporter [Nanoarchaeota archaeon]|nr:MAG: sodium:calcium antiporter [Nanoarchaeota archaeon]
MIEVLLFVVGLGVLIYSAEYLVKSVVGTSKLSGIPVFLISVLFVGFDPENLATGVISSLKNAYSITMGSIVGAAMVAIGLAFGITILFSNVKFKRVSWKVMITPILATLLFYTLSLDGVLSRIDGIILVLSFIGAIFIMVRSRVEVEAEHMDIKWGLGKSLVVLALSLIGIVVGSELLVNASKSVMHTIGISETFFGMVIVSFLISIEEIARELPAAIKGRSDITYGNVVGSILHFFLLNAGLVATIHPVTISKQILQYFPVMLTTILVASLIPIKKKVPKWAGLVLVLLYIIFILI